ncbi:MAG: hypothetical protein GY820_16860 [Gammaproteobacteria bacterium]|nr:hypothetical protein [Gammaproteobacteria bacterium]
MTAAGIGVVEEGTDLSAIIPLRLDSEVEELGSFASATVYVGKVFDLTLVKLENIVTDLL